MSEQAPVAPVSSQSIETQIENSNTESQQADSQAVDESDEGSVEAAKPVTKEEKKVLNRIKSLKLKVDGKEYNEELPFEIDEDPKTIEWMTKQLQLAKVSQKRMQEHSQLEKDVVAFIDELRTNPRKALANPEFGIDVKKLATEIIEAEIENASKTPEQIKAEALEEELRSLKEERKKESEESKSRELERLQNEAYERYDTQVTQALEKTDLPKTPYVVKKMADYMLMGLEAGHDVSPNDVVQLVREEILADIKDMFSAMPEETLEGVIGKDVINRLRKKNLAKVKSTKPATPVNSAIKDTGGNKPEAKAADKVNFKRFFGI